MLISTILIQATTFTVTNTFDSGTGSLRQAILDATYSGDSIIFDPAILSSGNATIFLTTGELIINKALSITGLINENDTLFISGNNSSRVFNMTYAVVNLNSIAITNGYAYDGGGIKIENTTLNMSNSLIINNAATHEGGGFYSSYSTYEIYNSKINNNSAINGGGGIYSTSGSTGIVYNSTISNNSAASGAGICSLSSTSNFSIYLSTISGNSATFGGGGIVTMANPEFNIDRSTISGNTAGQDGGGIYTSSNVEILYSTISDNNATNLGGGIFLTSSAITSIGSSIVALNGGVNNIEGAIDSSSGYNIFSDNPFIASGTGDQINVTSSELNLGILENNGGTTLTMIPLLGSVAINSGSPFATMDAQNQSLIGVRDVGAAESCKASFGIQSEISCGSFTWLNGQTYSSDTTITQMFIGGNLVGCDYDLTLDLVVLPPIDNSTVTTNETIVANQTGATYQWLDCDNNNSSILGATDSSFIATSNGNYAVVISTQNCSDTSACINISSANINEASIGKDITIYPNPTNGQLVIEYASTTSSEMMLILIYDLSGKQKYLSYINDSNGLTAINLADLEKGIYMINIVRNNNATVKKLIII